VIIYAVSSEIYRRFIETYCLIDVADLMTEAQLSLKRRDTSRKLHGITAQNIAVVLQLMLLRASIRYLL